MTHDELVGYVQAHKEGRLQAQNVGGDWWKVEGTCNSLCAVLWACKLRIAPPLCDNSQAGRIVRTVDDGKAGH